MSDLQQLWDRLDAVLQKDLFFLVGVGKSGTTWLQKLLDGHPEISCNGEGHFVDVLLPQLQDAPPRRVQRGLTLQLRGRCVPDRTGGSGKGCGHGVRRVRVAGHTAFRSSRGVASAEGA